MRIGKIINSEEYGRRIPKLANFWSKIFIFQIDKNSKNFPNFTIVKIIKFPLSTNSYNNQIFEIVQFRKIANFQNLTTRKISKFQKFLI